MKIEEIRKKLQMTQKQFSDWTRIPARSIQNWETGQRKPPEYIENLITEKYKEWKRMEEKIKRAVETYKDTINAGLTARIYYDPDTADVFTKEYISENDFTVFRNQNIEMIPIRQIEDEIIWERASYPIYNKKISTEEYTKRIINYINTLNE